MALQKNKIHVEGTTYEIAQAEQANISGTSDDKDTSNSNTWTDIEPLEDEEINSNIFNKMSKMFSNVRYLYNELGTGADSNGSSRSIKSQLNDIRTGTAPLKHRHSVVDKVDNIRVIPTNDVKSDKNDTLPTCALLSDMYTYLQEGADGLNKIETKLNEVEKRYNENPNERAPIGDGRHMGTFNSTADVDAFCAKYHSGNKYGGLRLGDYVTINDGLFNANWMIAGFDIEENNGSKNGKGICLIPKTVLPMMFKDGTKDISYAVQEWVDGYKDIRWVTKFKTYDTYAMIPYYYYSYYFSSSYDSSSSINAYGTYIDVYNDKKYYVNSRSAIKNGKDVSSYRTESIMSVMALSKYSIVDSAGKSVYGGNITPSPSVDGWQMTRTEHKDIEHYQDANGNWHTRFLGYNYSYNVWFGDNTGPMYCWSYPHSNLNFILNGCYTIGNSTYYAVNNYVLNKGYPTGNLKSILGNHLIYRNMRFAVPYADPGKGIYRMDTVDSYNYLTFPNQYQLYGALRNPYYVDKGYSNEILPVFKYINPNIDGYPYLIRDVGRWDPNRSVNDTINLDWGRSHNRFAAYTSTWGIGELNYGARDAACGTTITTGGTDRSAQYHSQMASVGNSPFHIGTIDKSNTAIQNSSWGAATNEVIYMRPYMYIR